MEEWLGELIGIDPSTTTSDFGNNNLSNADLYSQITGGGSSNLLGSLGSILSGGSGSMAQIASLGGLGALLNSLGGSSGGGYKGYQGSIPKYTASRTQYAPPVSTVNRGPAPSNEAVMDYLKRPGLNDSMIARSMNEYGVSPQQIADVTKSPVSDIQSRYQAAMGPNAGMARRPGSGGVTYFSPMVYTPQGAAPAAAAPAETAPATVAPAVEDKSYQVFAAGGMAHGGLGSLGHYSDGGHLLKGPGDGVSDSIPAMIGDKQPARLADGEFVIPARIVSEIGNGSTDAGARKLYAMMDRIQKARGKTLKNVAANTKADKHLPA
jgi:hypothetical protein